MSVENPKLSDCARGLTLNLCSNARRATLIRQKRQNKLSILYLKLGCMKHRTFTHALVRTPCENFAAGLTTQSLGVPDFALASKQYAAYLAALRACDLQVNILAGDPAYPDGQFVEDTAVIYDNLAVITQPGALSRRGEPGAIAEALTELRQTHMSGDAMLDGGDVLICEGRVLIGLSQRTNHVGASFLRDALCAVDTSLIVEFVTFSGVLHLKSGLTELSPGVLLKSPELKTEHNFAFAEVIELPIEEGYAADVLPINGQVIIPAGYPLVAALAAQHYNEVIALDMSEFAKMDGGLTCLSLLYTI